MSSATRSNPATTGAPRRTRTLGAALAATQVLLAVPVGAGGVQKLVGTEAMVDLFADIGAGQWLRLVVGTLEVVGAIGLVVPRVRGFAALGLAGVLIGAAFTNVVILDESPVLPMLLLVLTMVICWCHRESIQAWINPRRWHAVSGA